MILKSKIENSLDRPASQPACQSTSWPPLRRFEQVGLRKIVKNKHKPKDPECEQAEAFKFGLILAADDLGQTKGAVGNISKR